MAKDEFDSQSLIHDRFAIALVDSELAFLEIPAKLRLSNANKRMKYVMKEKLNPLVQEYRKINSKPK